MAAVLLFVTSACGFTAPRSSEGFANLDSPGMAETDRVMSLSFGPALLHFAARFVDDDPETQALLRSLDGVRLRIYEVHGDYENITYNFERMGHKLHDDGWDPVMLIREKNELVQMYAKFFGAGIQGLTIVSAESAEVVVVNIMGNIDPGDYTNIMLALDVDEAPEVQVVTMN